MGGMTRDLLREDEPGSLFTPYHWNKIACDLLGVVVHMFPEASATKDGYGWTSKVKPDTKIWAQEHLEYVKKQERLAREKALAKLTYEDRIALGLPT